MNILSIFQRPILGVLHADSIDFYDKGREKISLQFGLATISAMEIRDETQLIEEITQFIAKQNWVGRKIVFLISNSLIFSQALPKTEDVEVLQDFKLTFKKSLPFNQHDLVVTQRQTKVGAELLAVNGDFIQGIVQAVKTAGLETVRVVPAILAGLNINEPVTDQLARKSVGAAMRGSVIDFLNRLPESDHIVKKNGVERSRKILAGAVILVVALLISLVGVWYLLQTTNQRTETSSLQPEASPLPAVDLSEESVGPTDEEVVMVETIKKDEIILTILNGSGIAGEAGKVQKLFEQAGFTNTSTGNAPEVIEQTTITVGIEIDEPNRQEIRTLIETIFSSSILVETSTNSGGLVTIITGKNKL